MTNEETGEAEGSLNEVKLSRLEQIANSAEEAREGELKDLQDHEPETVEIIEEPVNEPRSEPEVAKVKLKINGHDREFTPEQIQALASKVASADEYLAQAKRAFETTQQHQVQPPSQDVVADDEDLALARALQMGNEAEAAAVIRKLRHVSPSINPDEVAASVEDRIRFKEATDRFQTEYKDIFEDQFLLKLAISEDERMVKEGDQRPYWDRYTEVGEKLRSWRGTSKSPLETKQERKAASVRVLPTANVRSATEKEEEPDDSPAAVIAKMAQARGQR